MNTRVILVKSCSECPFRTIKMTFIGYEHAVLVCGHSKTQDKPLLDQGNIPSWCPLEKFEDVNIQRKNNERIYK